MMDIGVNIAAILGGLIGGGVGFFVLGLVLAMLLVPYFYRSDGRTERRNRDEIPDQRF